MRKEQFANSAMAAQGAMGNILVDRGYDRTIGENIDARISMLEQEIEALKETKRQLSEPNGLLNVRIEDLRRAMSY